MACKLYCHKSENFYTKGVSVGTDGPLLVRQYLVRAEKSLLTELPAPGQTWPCSIPPVTMQGEFPYSCCVDEEIEPHVYL